MSEVSELLDVDEVRRLMSVCQFTSDEEGLLIEPNPGVYSQSINLTSLRGPARVRLPQGNAFRSITLPPKGGPPVYVQSRAGIELDEVKGEHMHVSVEGSGTVMIRGGDIFALTLTQTNRGGPGSSRVRVVALTVALLSLCDGDFEIDGVHPLLSELELSRASIGLSSELTLHTLRLLDHAAIGVPGGGPIRLSAERIAHDRDVILVVRNGSQLTVRGLPDGLTLLSPGDTTAPLSVLQVPSPTVLADGPVKIYAGNCSEGNLIAKKGEIQLSNARAMHIEAQVLETYAAVAVAKGSIGLLRANSGYVVLSDGVRVRSVGSATDAELVGLSPYELRLSDLQTLDGARLVQFRFKPWAEHIDAVAAQRNLDGVDASVAFWYRIGTLLERHGASGRDRAIVRRTEHEMRRRSLASGGDGRNAEQAWLGLYKGISYGDSALRPISLHVLMCTVLAALITVTMPVDLGYSWAVLWRLVLQPARFLLRDEVALKLTTDPNGEGFLLPHGLLSLLAPPMIQVTGVLLLATAVNAIRRLVKAR